MCGVVGVYGHPEAANLAYLGLYALQHRGQESAGIVSTDGDKLRVGARDGARQRHLHGRPAEGPARATRPSATCATRPRATHPRRTPSRSRSTTRAARSRSGTTATSSTRSSCASGWRRRARSSRPPPTPRCIVHLIARSRERTLPERVADALRQVRGAYSLVFLTEELAGRGARSDGLPAAGAGQGQGRPGSSRPRPARSSCSGAEFVRDVEPGEMVIIDEHGAAQRAPVRRAAAAPLRVRVGLLRAPRLDHRRARRSTARASGWGAGWPSSTRSRPTSSSRCPTRAWRPPSATRARAASPTTRG